VSRGSGGEWAEISLTVWKLRYVKQVSAIVEWAVKEVGMCAKILLEGKMDQPNNRGTLVHRDKSLTIV